MNLTESLAKAKSMVWNFLSQLLELGKEEKPQNSHLSEELVVSQEVNNETKDLEAIDTEETIEPCEQINVVNNDPEILSRALEATRGLSTTVEQAISRCSTGVASSLSKQIIEEMNQIESNCLVSFADLNVTLASGSSVNPVLQKAARDSLARIISDRGQTLSINSAYRTLAQQFMLYRQYQTGQCGIPLAAKPGNSNHEDGLALDVNDSAGWRPYFLKYGWQWQGSRDPVHYSYVGGGTRKDISNIAVKAFQRLWNRYNPDDKISEDGGVGPATLARISKAPISGFGDVDAPADDQSGRTLKLTSPRMQGEDVKKLQDALIKAGITVDTDGVYGSGTESAVKQFQEQKGLTADGIVGRQTLLELGL